MPTCSKMGKSIDKHGFLRKKSRRYNDVIYKVENKWRSIVHILLEEKYKGQGFTAGCQPRRSDYQFYPTYTQHRMREFAERKLLQKFGSPTIPSEDVWKSVVEEQNFDVRADSSGACSSASELEEEHDNETDDDDDVSAFQFRPTDYHSGEDESATANVSKRSVHVKFSELVRDLFIRENIPRYVYERFIRDLKREVPEFDLEDMPLSWETLAKLESFESKELGRIIKIETRVGKRDSEYVHFGLKATVEKKLPFVLKKMFCEGETPKRPHVVIELWTDGAPLSRTGDFNNFYPLSCCILAVGDGVHFHRAPRCISRRPFLIGAYLGTNKPDHASDILRKTVDELKELDPNRAGDDPMDLGFTVSLGRVVGDAPARAFMKDSVGHSAADGCEKCLVLGSKARHTGINRYSVETKPRRKDEDFLTYKEYLKVHYCGTFHEQLFVFAVHEEVKLINFYLLY